MFQTSVENVCQTRKNPRRLSIRCPLGFKRRDSCSTKEESGQDFLGHGICGNYIQKKWGILKKERALKP